MSSQNPTPEEREGGRWKGGREGGGREGGGREQREGRWEGGGREGGRREGEGREEGGREGGREVEGREGGGRERWGEGMMREEEIKQEGKMSLTTYIQQLSDPLNPVHISSSIRIKFSNQLFIFLISILPRHKQHILP